VLLLFKLLLLSTVLYALWFVVIPMWHEHQRDSEADVEAGTAARQQRAQTLDQLRRDMAAGTAAADAKVLLRVLFAASLPGTHRVRFMCGFCWDCGNSLHRQRESKPS
jgi:hypothetical protein